MGHQQKHTKKHSLSSIYKKYIDRYLRHPDRKLYVTKKHLVAVNKTIHCGTSVIGKLVYGCESCSHVHNILRRCGHRSCSRCGYAETQNWANKTLSRLAPIKHHHIVFTLPVSIRGVSKLNGDKLHDHLFNSAKKTVIGYYEERYKLKPGIVSVLHTFGSDLSYHPHVHMIVTAGGQNDESEIEELKGDYLVSQRKLANRFRGVFMSGLRRKIKSGEVILPERLQIKRRQNKWEGRLKAEQWICSIQKPLRDIFQIVGYVGRYTKRACISEYKIESIKSDEIIFVANDYKNTKRGEKPKQREIRLSYVEFLDRLLQHVPTKRYRMVRYSGLYNSHYLKKQGEKYKEENYNKLDEKEIEIYRYRVYRELVKSESGRDPLICPTCKKELVFRQLVFSRYRDRIDDG